MRTGSLEVDLFSPTAVMPEIPGVREGSRFTRPPMGHSVYELYAGPVDAEGRPDHRGHSGGDEALIDGFITSLEGGEAAATDLEASLDSHRMAFAAERSRLEGRTIDWGTT